MRWLIKIGTSNLCKVDGRLDEAKIADFSGQIARLYYEGHQLLLVSSGAVGAGIGEVGRRPRTVQEKQALAAVGQARLIHAWRMHLGKIVAAQILLTSWDLSLSEGRRKSARTLEQLIAWGILPIINENDTVADEEIRIGDNDTLAARVACLTKADRLVLLSDVDGLYTKNPRQHRDAEKIDRVPWVTDEFFRIAEGAGDWGTGGMLTKLAAVRICQEERIPTVVANGQTPAVLQQIAAGNQQCGTWFTATPGEAVRL